MKDLELYSKNQLSVIMYRDGPWMGLFQFQIVLFFLLFLFVFMHACKIRKRISFGNCARVTEIMSIGVISFAIDQFELFPIITYPFSYLLMEIVLVIVVQKINIHDVESNIVNYMLQQNDYGYIFLDKKKRFLGANHAAEDLLSQIKDLVCDQMIDKQDIPVFRTMFTWLKDYDKDDTHSIETSHKLYDDEKAIICLIRPLCYGIKNEKVGYTIVMYDDSQQHHYINQINNYNSELEEIVQEKVEHIEELHNNMLISFANIVENRDFSTGDHVKRTSQSVRIFMEYLKRMKPDLHFTDQFIENVWRAAPMHDLGKIAVPDMILNKPGKYTREEFGEMQTHSEKGENIVREVLTNVEEPEFVEVAANIAHYHHERWDGTGYPEGLKGEQIPVEARIMALADVFDALVSERCYKKAMSYEQAFHIIRDSLGTHFDPILGTYFLECHDELIILYEREKSQKNPKRQSKGA